MTALAVGEGELRALFVTKLEMIDQAEFDKARNMATRLRIPIERALAERGRIPLPFLLEQLADAGVIRVSGSAAGGGGEVFHQVECRGTARLFAKLASQVSPR